MDTKGHSNNNPKIIDKKTKKFAFLNFIFLNLF